MKTLFAQGEHIIVEWKYILGNGAYVTGSRE